MKKLKFEHYFLIAIAALTAFTIYLSWSSPFSKAVRNGERINAILIGTDWVDYARHSDTLMFVSYDPKTRFLDVISIPRDTHFSPKGYNFRKINEVFAYHFHTKHSDRFACMELRAAVEELFQNRVKIPYHFEIDYRGFKNFIDLIGGVTIDIDEPMNYDDNWGKLHIHFLPGRRHLDGQNSLEYVRFRATPAADIGRIARQQRFLRCVLAKIKNPMVLFRFPQAVSSALKDIDTNLTLWDLTAGALELKDLNMKNIRLAQLPGRMHGTYWEPDHENTAAMLDKIFPSSGTIVASGPKVRVEVWNASGRPGLAEKISWVLRQDGYDVTDWGNYSTIQKKTVIKDLTDNLRAAQKISEIIQCGEVIERYDNKRFADISIEVGEDCVIGTGKDSKLKR